MAVGRFFSFLYPEVHFDQYEGDPTEKFTQPVALLLHHILGVKYNSVHASMALNSKTAEN